MKRYIAVAGNIGSGKTSLVDFLCKTYKLKPFFEPNDTNPYLSDFYGDMKRWAFQSQVYFLTHKFRLHRELERYEGTVVQDRTIYEDAEIFAENLHRGRCIEPRDYTTYRELYETIRKDLRPPDVMIFLACSVRVMRKRIAHRGRGMEQGIPSAYLARLNKLYGEWRARYDLSPVIDLNTDKIDYVTDLLYRHDLLTSIGKFF